MTWWNGSDGDDMTDFLDRLAEPAEDLLSKVDAVLVRVGAPADHPLVPLLRHLGALPGEAVAAVTTLGVQPLSATGPALRNISHSYARVRVTAPDWHGRAADAFTNHLTALSAHVEHNLSGRLAGTACFADAVADWAGRTRRAVAGTLATVLASAEAVTVVCGAEPDQLARAAADIAARVLGTVADAYAEGEALLVAWSGKLDELAHPSLAWLETTGSITRCFDSGGAGRPGQLDVGL